MERTLTVPALALALAACGPSSSGDTDTGGTNGTTGTTATTTFPPPDFEAASFSGAPIDNPFNPLVPGTTLNYAETFEDLGIADTAYEITADTKEILGVTCVVVHDVTTQGATVLEDTYDWYAQDDAGNVWYMGEDTTAYDEGAPDTSGSWTAGEDGAVPGIIMEADPQVGDAYRQEYRAGEAEDQAEVISTTESVTVQAGTYDDCIQTNETTALEPDLIETKWYARGIGEIKAVDVQGGSDTSELVSVTTGGTN